MRSEFPLEMQYQEDGEPDGDWLSVPANYLNEDIRECLEGLLESTYIDLVEVTYNISAKHVLSTKFRKGQAYGFYPEVNAR